MKRLFSLSALSLLGLILVFGAAPRQAHAAFVQNNIIDDVKFDNAGSMSQSDIQNFLNLHSPCLKNYQSEDPIDYFTYGDNVPASQVIYKASQAWGINPQVILTTLDKEESLLTGTSCDDWRYNSAMGMGCPDGGACPAPAYAGFSRQVMKGSWQLKFNKERAYGNTAWDGDGSVFYGGYMTQGNRARQAGGSTVFYDGNATIDGTTVHMDNGATAALYTYTPHFHGNQSFVTIYEKWFGAVHGGFTGNYTASVAGDGTVYLFDRDGGKRYSFSDPDSFLAYGFQWGGVPQVSTDTLNSLTYAGTASIYAKIASDDTIYLIDSGQKKPMSAAAYAAFGTPANVITLSDSLMANIPLGPEVTSLGRTPDGSVYFLTNGTKRPVPGLVAFNALGYSWSNVRDYSSFTLGKLSTGNTILPNFGVFISSNDPTAYLIDGSKKWPLTADSFAAFGIQWQNVFRIDQASAGQFTTASNAIKTLVKDSSGNQYLMLGGLKRPIPSTFGLSAGLFDTPSDGLLSAIGTGPILSNLIRDDNGSVYQLSAGQRRPISSVAIFNSFGFSWANVVLVSNATAGQIPVGAMALPDLAIVQVSGDASIYVVDGSLKRPVSADAFAAWGMSWDRVIRIDGATANTYSTTTPLNRIVKDTGSTIWLIDGAQRHGFPSTTELSAYGYTTGSAQTITTSLLVTLGVSPSLNRFAEGSGGTVFLMDSGQKKPIPDPATFIALGGSWDSITHLSDAYLNSLPTGATATP